jgi:hypothetical protein
MGLGSEEDVSLGNFEVKGDKSFVFGGYEGLPKNFLELSLNGQGNLRVKRLEGANPVNVWGLAKVEERLIWLKWSLRETLPDKVYEKIDGRPVVIDIEVPTRKNPEGLVRINDAGQIRTDSRLYRIDKNPSKRDLGARN